MEPHTSTRPDGAFQQSMAHGGGGERRHAADAGWLACTETLEEATANNVSTTIPTQPTTTSGADERHRSSFEATADPFARAGERRDDRQHRHRERGRHLRLGSEPLSAIQPLGVACPKRSFMGEIPNGRGTRATRVDIASIRMRADSSLARCGRFRSRPPGARASSR